MVDGNSDGESGLEAASSRRAATGAAWGAMRAEGSGKGGNERGHEALYRLGWSESGEVESWQRGRGEEESRHCADFCAD